MANQVLINVGPGETRVAILEDGRLSGLRYERPVADCEGGVQPKRAESRLADIILGRVQRVLPGIQAAFVDIGLDRAGFLSARDAQSLSPYVQAILGDETAPLKAPCISSLVREGDILLVQIIKDPIGEKGARLTAGITMPGRLLVSVPRQPVMALSRRITEEADRARLLEAAETLRQRGRETHGIDCGFIIRTSALEASHDELLEDAERLWRQWLAILDAQKTARAPKLLHRDLPSVLRTLRDHMDGTTERVVIDNAAAFREAQNYARAVLPDCVDRIQRHDGELPIFEAHGIEGEIDALMSTRVNLPSGGWITIETTEALTAVDVNSGSFDASCLAETSFATNLAAATELGRQLALRGIGGIVVVDFIHMDDPLHVEAVMEALNRSLACDRVPVQVSPMSPFGLVAITRKRVREPLGRLLTGGCSSCLNTGRVKSAATIANDVLRRIEREARLSPCASVRVRVAPDVAQWITERARSVLDPLRERLGRPLFIEPVRHFPRDRFEVDATSDVA